MLKKTLNLITGSGPAWIGVFVTLYLCSLIAVAGGFTWLISLVGGVAIVSWLTPWKFSVTPGSFTAQLVKPKYFWLVACLTLFLIWQLGTQLESANTFYATFQWMIACILLCNPLGGSFSKGLRIITSLFRS